MDVPMNALRAFEVAARAGSFVQAGVELGVTAAAVSQQVKALEGRLARQLFVRQGNRITLTDAGRALFFRVEGPFADLAAAMAEVGERPVRARLVVSVLPVLAEWLVGRLGGVAGAEIRVEEDPVVLARDGVDLRLTYGAHLYPDHRVEVLFRDVLVAVAAPGAEGAPLVHSDWGRAMARSRVGGVVGPARGPGGGVARGSGAGRAGAGARGFGAGAGAVARGGGGCGGGAAGGVVWAVAAAGAGFRDGDEPGCTAAARVAGAGGATGRGGGAARVTRPRDGAGQAPKKVRAKTPRIWA